jgi:K+-sensing histidine kinase KdpD
VEAHHGRIWAQNNPKGGASFFIAIPARIKEDKNGK